MSTTVWLVDDCPLATKLTKARLTALGADVYTFVSGGAAIAAWIKGELPHPVALLFDMYMPGPTGAEAGRILRDAGYTGVLLLHTTEPEAHAARDLEACGFDGSVTKPASKDDLRRVIADAMQARNRQSA